MPNWESRWREPSKFRSQADRPGGLRGRARHTFRENMVYFGHPGNPHDDTSTDLAGDMTVEPAHNGTLHEIGGSWVEVEIEDTSTAFTCDHNLYRNNPNYTVPVAGAPNCRWFVGGWQHDGEQNTYWDDQQIVLGTARLAGASDPVWTAYKGGEVLLFNKGQDNIIYFTAQLSHKYKFGTNLHFHVHMVPVNDVAQNECRWVFTYSWADIGNDFPAETTTTVDQTVAANTADRHTYFEIDGAVSSASAEADVSGVLICSLMREGTHTNDDLDTDVYLVAMDFHYEIDSPGSDSEDSKTAPAELEITPFNIYFLDGDTVNANNIQLRCAADPLMQIDGTHPLKVTLFFIEAIQ